MKFVLMALTFSCLVVLSIFRDTALVKNNGHHTNFSADVIMHNWAVERAQNSVSYQDFLNLCEISSKGCFRYDSVPYEWPFLYSLSKLGKMVGLNSSQTINAWYLVTLVLNILLIASALFILTRNTSASLLLSIPVAFQFSVVEQITEGHLFLSFISPPILSLSLFAFFMFNFEKFQPKFKILTALGISLLTLITFYTSYTYTLFSFILHFAAFMIFIIYNRKNQLIAKLKSFLPILIFPAIVVATLWLPFNLHIIRGADGFFDGDVHDRSLIGVSIYSARPMDFINPPDGTVLRKVLNVVKFNYQHPQNRGEVYAYLGSAILLILVLVFSVSLKNKSYKFQNIKKYFSEQKFEVFFLLMSLVAMFFTLRNGGYFIYYTLTKGIRVFNRMAPYVSFMWVVFISFWLERHFSKKTFLIIISVIAFISLSEVNLHSSVNKMKEHISSGAQNRQLLKLEKLESELKELCTRGHIIIEPAFTKFFTNGQWLPQYLLERSNCLADGGSSIENFPNPNHLKNSTPVAKFILDGPTWLGVDDNYRIEVLSE